MRFRALRAHLLIYAVYLLIAVLITWPLVLQISTRLIGHPFGDAYEYARHIWWIKHALQTGQPLFDQPLLAYPDGLTGAWLWGNPLQSFPGWLLAFVLPLPLAFNLAVLLSLALNGWAMYWMMCHLLQDQRAAAFLAGLAYLAAPVFQGQLGAGHTGLLVLWPLPLYVYGLSRLHVERSWHWLVFSAVFFTASLWGNMLVLVFITLPLTMLILFMRLAGRDKQGALGVLGAAALGMLLALPFVLPVALEAASVPPRLREGNEVRYSADLLSIVTPSFLHPLFRSFEFTHRVLGIEPFERVGYVGAAAASLALLALLKRKVARWWLLLALVSWILSLGPLLKVFDSVVNVRLDNTETYITLPWLALQNLPLLSLTRTPARFNMTAAFALSVMVGCGAAAGWQSAAARLPALRRIRGGLLALVAGVILFEYQFFWPLPTIPGVVPDSIRSLSERQGVRAVLDLPWDHLLVDKEGLFLQTGHQHPMIGGHVTRRTPVDPARMTLLQETLDYALLDEAGADIVIVHKEWDSSDGALYIRAVSRFGTPFYEDGQFAAFDVPPPLEEPGFAAVPSSLPAVAGQADSYLYTPEPGWVQFSAILDADAGGRSLTLALDGEPVHQWLVSSETAVNLALPIRASGYHTVSLTVNPPCPLRFSSTLRCRAVDIQQLRLDQFSALPFTEPVLLDHGVRLLAAHLLPEPQRVSIWLLWRFDQPRRANEVRFVHVLSADGNNIAQEDIPLGEYAAGSTWLERVELALPDNLPSGEYRIYTGWYTLPDVTRFSVLSAVPGAADGLIELGAFTIEN